MTIEELEQMSEKEIILYFAMMTDEEKLFWRIDQARQAQEKIEKEEQEKKDCAMVENAIAMRMATPSIRSTEEYKLAEMLVDFRDLIIETRELRSHYFNENVQSKLHLYVDIHSIMREELIEKIGEEALREYLRNEWARLYNPQFND